MKNQLSIVSVVPCASMWKAEGTTITEVGVQDCMNDYSIHCEVPRTER